ncbi:uncharacterized protein LOC103953324 isoform X4 [Pyrus x bretschneideri]|uniref:uncharacterized protein LOC103953324 isoform X4 n=1 Tax=Pyrus x bretschneideri TaxID=225117 RepID=UPI00202E0E15|nr:uncharacterized protein LOC103953324 isoform X4 [Pyrus x bretschneideri]
MTSFKKLDHRQSTTTLVERWKMLAAKVGKIHKARIRPRTENSTCSRGVEPQFLVLLLVLRSCGGDLFTSDLLFRYFKVYTESDTAKADAGIGSYATVNKVSTVENTAALKAGLKSMEKQKGILGSSAANANVGRRPLADVSNVQSNSSRIVGGDASKGKSGKGERIKSLQQVSVGTGVQTELIIKDILLGKGRESFNTSEMLENAGRNSEGKRGYYGVSVIQFSVCCYEILSGQLCPH